jgi:hypothetical protein
MYRLSFDDGSTVQSLTVLPSIEDAQAFAEGMFDGPLWWETPTKGRHPNPADFAGYYLIEEIEDMTETQPDLQALIAAQIQEQLGQLAQQAPQSFEDALNSVDPADSEAALGMLDFLLKTGRLNRVGVLDGGQGYLFMYQEPKGSTKQGYRPGATQGDRIVDEAIDAQRATGRKPIKQGLCPKCMSAVGEISEGTIVDETGATECPAAGPQGGLHEMV